MVRGEEQQFEVIVERLIEYAKNIKISLLVFIQRIENERDNIDWPQVLDSFSTISGQINTLLRFTRENRSQFIENRVALPLVLSPDRDEDLVKLTEGRVQMVDHEMVPSYLRTKPDPEIEELEKALLIRSNAINSDAASKQQNAMRKLIDTTINTIKTNSVRVDNEMLNKSLKPSFNNNDTNELLAAVSGGKGLRTAVAMHRGNEAMMSPVVQQQMVQKQNVKAPELKTNIKAGP